MKPLLDLLFSWVNETIQQFAGDPQWRLQGKPGFIAVLHTWNQTLLYHFHLHCLIPVGVLSEDGTTWTPSRKNHLFRTRALAQAFKGIYIKGLKQLYAAGVLKFPDNTVTFGTPSGFGKLIKTIRKKKWSGYAKSPCSGPEKILEYLGRYPHRVAISNYLIKSFENGKVMFTWRDRTENNALKKMTLDAVEFIRRFMLHTLPKEFKKIRHFGFLSPRYKIRNIKLILQLVGEECEDKIRPTDESVEEMMHRLTGIEIKACPKCGKGRLIKLYELLPVYVDYIVPNRKELVLDTSLTRTLS